MGVIGFTQRTLHKSNKGSNRVIPDVGLHGRLANLCSQRLESAWNGTLQVTI
jgi:hypothetical protein